MKVIIEGDDSKMIDNFTEIMFYITLQRIKNNNLELNKKETIVTNIDFDKKIG